jgi:hypothetical protein
MVSVDPDGTRWVWVPQFAVHGMIGIGWQLAPQQ